MYIWLFIFVKTTNINHPYWMLFAVPKHNNDFQEQLYINAKKANILARIAALYPTVPVGTFLVSPSLKEGNVQSITNPLHVVIFLTV